MARVLFVCSGNVFRSLSAELAFKDFMTEGADVEFASAGIIATVSQPVREDVRERLEHWNTDPAGHVPRLLTREILEGADLVVAMGKDHKAFILEQFNVEAVLFLDIAEGRAEGILDLWEAVPDYKTQPEAARVCINSTIDRIFEDRQAFLRHLPRFLGKKDAAPARPAPPRV